MVMHVAIAYLGLILSTILFLSCITKESTTSMMLILFLCYADILFCLTCAVFGTLDLAHGSFATGFVGCIIYTLLILSSCFYSILFVSLIALERYAAIVLARPLTKKDIWKLLHINSIVGTASFIIPFALNDYSQFALQSSREVCSNAFWRHEPLPLISTVVCLFVMIGSTIVLVFCYGTILRSYLRLRTSMKDTATSIYDTQSAPPDKSQKDLERRLLIKCIAVSGVYVFFWSPYTIKILVEVITGKPLEVSLDIFCHCFALLNSALNPVVLYVFDARIRTNINQFLRLGTA
ncbi:hypothetical protein EDD86DRAFT_206623 [Gorgonomyces haynaldii]|nr:hypothetical protein EDD86DRAFT_206623 [Gorgonomyces haynaldii]